jgi:hypothetical protein
VLTDRLNFETWRDKLAFMLNVMKQDEAFYRNAPKDTGRGGIPALSDGRYSRVIL